ncbi:hypothetical protein VTI74DRAFT_8209 [Chaetomium olivicolor]
MVFNRPEVDYTAESALGALAEFWESEVARIGEGNAKGWKQFVEAGGQMADPPDPRSDGRGILPRTTDPFEAWAATEQQCAEKARMPARTLDEGTDDDPFRVVMFSDIKDLLIWFPSTVLPRVRPLLSEAFLVFCGLPPAGVSGERFTALLNDPFAASKGQGLNLGVDRDDAPTRFDISTRTPEFKQQGGRMAISPEVLFSGNTWFQYLDKWSGVHPPQDRQVDALWVLRTLGHLVRGCGLEELAEYYLAMEWLNEPAAARKVAKGLLKQYSSNVRLYNAYALIEWANGNTEMSQKVLSSATGLASSFSSNSSQPLWNTWAWMHLESGDKAMSLARLCSSVDRGFEGLTVSPALLLKARSQFSATRDYSLSSQQLEAAAESVESLMLLEYLIAEGGSEPASDSQGNITAALDSIHAFSRELESRDLARSPHHERLLQNAARLLYYHATHGPYRPTHLRNHLHLLLAHFPTNTLLLTLFAWSHQSTLRIDDPVRTFLQQTLSQPANDTLAARRFAINHEFHAGTAHSVRAAFESALESEACKGSVELWTAYVRLCAGNQELKGRAKEVFYRAIAACPWAKEVYMLAFEPGMKGVLGREELRAVHETLVAKGLRVGVDLEEVLERWKKERRRGRRG